jgi:hypothetical protein
MPLTSADRLWHAVHYGTPVTVTTLAFSKAIVPGLETASAAAPTVSVSPAASVKYTAIND